MENLIDLFQAKTLTREFKTNTFTFKLRTLTADELTYVLRRADILATSEDTRVYIAKKITIAYALESVNGVDVLALPEINNLKASSEELKSASKVDLMMRVLGTFDADTITDLYNCYNKMIEENEASRQSLKKASVVR